VSALGKSANHIRFNGDTSPGTGTDCRSCHLVGTSFVKTSLSGGAASNSGEHLYVTNFACATCHATGSSFPNVTMKTPAAISHIPFGSIDCGTCHASTSSFVLTQAVQQSTAHTTYPGQVALCSTCHGATATYTAVKTITAKVGHIPVGSSDCSACHSQTAFLPAAATHTHTSADAGQCLTCHNGSATSAIKGKIANHITTTASCDVCHTTASYLIPSPTFTIWTMGATGHGVVSSNCNSCHLATGNHDITGGAQTVTVVGTAAKHIPILSTAACTACHASTKFDNFSGTWNASTMSHAAVSTTTCNACHAPSVNTTFTSATPLTIRTMPTPSGPGGHIPVTGDCAVCHTSGDYSVNGFTQTWTATSMKHSAVNTGTCSVCHAKGVPDYVYATNVSVVGSQTPTPPPGTTAYHISPGTGGAPTVDCSNCHTSLTSFGGAGHTHASTDAGKCNTCHTGSGGGMTKIANHIATTAQCDVCHTTWINNLANETGVFAACSSNPKSCMGTATAHGAVTNPTACASCHLPSGTLAITGGTTTVTVVGIGSVAKHIPINSGAACTACHANNVFTTFSRTWTATLMSHAAVSTATCNACHAPSVNTSFSSTPALTIRTMPSPSGPGGHIPVTGDCAVCHTSGNYTATGFTQTWTGSNMQHSAVDTGTCSVCHAKAVADYTFATNVRVIGSQTPTPPAGTSAYHTLAGNAPTADCAACHLSLTSFAGAGHTHTSADAGKCLTCHNGTGGGMTKIANHITTTASCDVCHTTWLSNLTNETGVFAACSTNPKSCMGAAGHAVVSQTCASCHLPSGTLAITGGATTVTVVGIGSVAKHIPINSGAACTACHSAANFSTFSQTWTAALMSHSAVNTATCNACHAPSVNTSFTSTVPLTIRTTPTQAAGPNPSGHIPVTGDCAVCHSSGNYTATGFTQTWSGANMHHEAVNTGTCSVCHAKATTDYSFATSVKVIGSQTSPPPAGTVAYHTLTGNAPTSDCSACHSSLTTFAGAAGHTHTSADAGKCNNCHTGTGGGKTKPSNHIVTTAQCDVCHGTGSYLVATPTFTVWTMNHSGVAAAGNCISCHNGQTFADSSGRLYAAMPRNKANTNGLPHLTTALSCDICHSGTTTFANGTLTSAQHTSNGNIANCATCHGRNGIGANVLGFTGNLPPKYMPTNHMSVVASAPCEICHTSTSTFAGQNVGWQMGATQHGAAYVSVPCSSCHNGQTFATGVTPKNKTNTTAGAHINMALFSTMPTECSACHTSTTLFTTERMNHGSFKGGSVTAGCGQCHDTVRSAGIELPSIIIKKTIGSHEGSRSTQDCVSSGCHSVQYSAWNSP
jgi:hypothetical protein